MFLKYLKAPKSQNVTALSWHGNGLKLALGAGDSMFLVNCKLFYKMCYLKKSHTFVFSVERENRVEFCVVFYNVARNTRVLKYMRNLSYITSHGDMCLIICQQENAEEVYNVILCNSKGNPIETKIINIDPYFVEMTDRHIVIASNENIYVWNYKTSVAKRDFGQGKDTLRFGREIAFHISDAPDTNSIYDYETYNKQEETL